VGRRLARYAGGVVEGIADGYGLGLLFVVLGGGLLLCKGTDIRFKPTTHF